MKNEMIVFVVLISTIILAGAVSVNSNFLQPKISSLTVDGDIGALAKATATICNTADIEGYVDVSANALDGGFMLNPATTTVKIGANTCTDTYFTLSKAADSFKGRLKVTASSEGNSDSKTITIETTARDVAPAGEVDPCIMHPESCKQSSPPLGLIVFAGVVIFVIVIYAYNYFRKESRTNSPLFCQRCGAGISKDAKFCEKCGQKLG